LTQDKPPIDRGAGSAAATPAADREARLKAKLRANLARRKNASATDKTREKTESDGGG